MFRVNRKLAFAVAFAAALVMLFMMSSVAFAGGDTVCVDGYVINHREQAVDGTRTEEDLIVQAFAKDDSEPYSAAVGTNGYFKFKNLPAGDLNFKMELPQDWVGIVPEATAPDDGSLAVAETGVTTFKKQDACYRIIFKIRRTFGILVNKWEENLDGTVEPGEGWTITATPIGDPFVKPKTDKTDAGGAVGFTLTAGKWTLSETLKKGWKAITPSSLTLVLDQYAPSGAREPVIFKNLEPPCHTEIDVEKRGVDKDDKPLGVLAGWKVTVSRADGTMTPITKVTDAFGQAHFGGLLPGVYVVTEEVKSGWEKVSDNPQTVVREDCEQTGDITKDDKEIEPVKFVNRELKGKLQITGRKYFKAWVPPYAGTTVGLPGWTITATLVGKAEVVTTTVTDALGNYKFSEKQLDDAGMAFPGASIKVCEEDRDNWIHVTPKCVTVKFPYPVPATYTGAVANFTNQEDPPPSTSVAAAPQAAGCRASLVVPKGETLARIAGQYGTSVRALVRANHIRNADLVYAGQRLCIP